MTKPKNDPHPVILTADEIIAAMRAAAPGAIELHQQLKRMSVISPYIADVRLR